MKILHTADWHIGQVLYQNYDRTDEHESFFKQLENWCRENKPDALLVSGDIFDIQQPSAAVKRFYNDNLVRIARQNPAMRIVVTAGNHDSASRIAADKSLWESIGCSVVGLPPTAELTAQADWQADFVVELESGFIIALPHMNGNRHELTQSILDYVASKNTTNKPVVMMAHTAISDANAEGHSEIGKMITQPVEEWGAGYDYLALGHIHKPQTLGYSDENQEESTYPAGIARYSGSALHVSCDEKYPHSVSLVELNEHGGEVKVKRLRINELRHFYELPGDGKAAKSAQDALGAVADFCKNNKSGYIRLHIDYSATMPADFDQQVYSVLDPYDNEIRYNPKVIWNGAPAETAQKEKVVFQVAELQEMKNPMDFIEKTKDLYPDLKLEEVRAAFEEVAVEMQRMAEEEKKKTVKKSVVTEL